MSSCKWPAPRPCLITRSYQKILLMPPPTKAREPSSPKGYLTLVNTRSRTGMPSKKRTPRTAIWMKFNYPSSSHRHLVYMTKSTLPNWALATKGVCRRETINGIEWYFKVSKCRKAPRTQPMFVSRTRHRGPLTQSYPSMWNLIFIRKVQKRNIWENL